MQTVIVYIVVALAAMGAGIYFFRRLRGMRKKECSSCSGCPLKEKCSGGASRDVPPEGGGCGC